ncbi:hypothetical protein ACFO3I_09115 [Rheinheimera marina]|uniref:Secreted protein n=1 Tax=Rheinheimera marina TaxID=1774958 RepID=A0ABV9JLW0_9GAMM
MKSLVKLVAATLFVLSTVDGYSFVNISLGLDQQAQKQFLANTCPTYPFCKQEFQTEQTPSAPFERINSVNMPLIANTCPTYPMCKQEFESELA